MERDSQRAKVFNAIRKTVAELNLAMPLDRIQAMLERTRDRAPIQKRYGHVLFRLADGRGRRSSGVDIVGKTISLPLHRRDAVWALVNYAHLVLRKSGSIGERHRNELTNRHNAAWHGWEYCAVLLDLMHFGLGEREADVLKHHFETEKVRFRKPVVLTGTTKLKRQETGRALAELMKERKLRERFFHQHQMTNDDIISRDLFEEYWETLYLLWK